jgi:hypothetical protein
MTVSRHGAATFLKCYENPGSVARVPGSGTPMKITTVLEWIREEHKKINDDVIAVQLHVHINTRGYRLSLHTILRCKTWTFQGSSYC